MASVRWFCADLGWKGAWCLMVEALHDLSSFVATVRVPGRAQDPAETCAPADLSLLRSVG